MAKITRSLPIIKWTEAFQDFLHQVIGVRTIPLTYVIRTTVDVLAAMPLLQPNQLHSDLHGSVEAELVAQALHAPALFQDDNSVVYYHLEEATSGTTYAASIKPFQRRKDGRGAWTALTMQYAGKDKWESKIKRQDDLLYTRQWKGQLNFHLEGFIAQHRTAFISMQQCTDHVEYQLLNEHAQVGCLLEGIVCLHASLQAAMASNQTDDGADGMWNNFKVAAAHILPYDPVAKKRAAAGSKCMAKQIALAEVGDVREISSASKVSIGKSGVHLKYHTPNEYHKLNDEQKTELQEWRANTSDSKKPAKQHKQAKHNNNKTFNKKQVSVTIAKEVKKAFDKKANGDGENNEPAEIDAEEYITSMVQATVSKLTTTTNNATAKPKVTLKSILKQSKNGQP